MPQKPRFSKRPKKQQRAKTPVTDNASKALQGLDKSPDQNASASETAGSPTLSDPIVQKRSVVEKAEGRPRPSASAADLDTIKARIKEIKARIKEIQVNLRGHKPSSFADPLKDELKKLKAELKKAEDRLQFGVPEGEPIMEESDADSDADKEEHSDAEEEQTLQPSSLGEIVPDSQPESQQEPGTLKQPETQQPLQPVTAVAAEAIEYFQKGCSFDENGKLRERSTLVDLIKEFKVPQGTNAPGQLPAWIEQVLNAQLLKVGADPSEVSFTFAEDAGEVHIKLPDVEYSRCFCLQCTHMELCHYIADKLGLCVAHLLKKEISDPIVQENVEYVFEAYFKATQFVTLCAPFEISKPVQVSFLEQERKLLTPFHQADLKNIFQQPAFAQAFSCPFEPDLEEAIMYAPNPLGLGICCSVRKPIVVGDPFVGSKELPLAHTVVNEAVVNATLLFHAVNLYNELNIKLNPLQALVATYTQEDLRLLSSDSDRGGGLNSDVEAAIKQTADKVAEQNPWYGGFEQVKHEVYTIFTLRRPGFNAGNEQLTVVKEDVYTRQNGFMKRVTDAVQASKLSKFSSGDLPGRLRDLEPLKVKFVRDNLFRTETLHPNKKVQPFAQCPNGARPTTSKDQKKFDDGKFIQKWRRNVYIFKCTMCGVTGLASTPETGPNKLGFDHSSLAPLREATKVASCECLTATNDFTDIGLENLKASTKRKPASASASHQTSRVFGWGAQLTTRELDKYVGPAKTFKSSGGGKKKKRSNGEGQDYPTSPRG
jgi:hypothetical protein